MKKHKVTSGDIRAWASKLGSATPEEEVDFESAVQDAWTRAKSRFERMIEKENLVKEEPVPQPRWRIYNWDNKPIPSRLCDEKDPARFDQWELEGDAFPVFVHEISPNDAAMIVGIRLVDSVPMKDVMRVEPANKEAQELWDATEGKQ